jgi:hypothetical protein
LHRIEYRSLKSDKSVNNILKNQSRRDIII